MKKFILSTAIAAVLGLVAGGAIANDHEGNGHGNGMHKGGMMKRIDTNGDGVVSKAEFIAKHEEMFTKMDKDGDGSLTKDEMKDARQHMREKHKKRQEMKQKKAAE